MGWTMVEFPFDPVVKLLYRTSLVREKAEPCDVERNLGRGSIIRRRDEWTNEG